MGARALAAALSITSVVTAACGGGGGGNGGVLAPSPSQPGTPSPSQPGAPVSSFSSVQANEPLVMDGTSATLTGTGGPLGSVPGVMSAGSAIMDSGTVTFTYDAGGKLTALRVTSPQASFSFNANTAPGSITCEKFGMGCSAFSTKVHLTLVDPFVAGWHYQSFGVWGETTYYPFGPWGINFFEPTWRIAAFSVGTPTRANALPATGSAVYKGVAHGFYFDPVTQYPHATSAKMTANANFGTRSIRLSTSETRRQGFQTTDNGLNLTGSLSYSAGVNALNGNIQTENGLLKGQAAGRFYGPAAEEIGGVYALQGTGVARMVGGFGGKR